MDTSRMLELPHILVGRILEWLPRSTSLRLRLTCKQLDEVVTARVTSLVLPATDSLSSRRGFSERYCNIRKLTVLDSAKQEDILLLVRQSPDLFKERLDELHVHIGIEQRQLLQHVVLVPMLISALGPKQQLSVRVPQEAVNATLSHLCDNNCLTRLNALRLQEPAATLPLVSFFNQMHQLTELHYTNASPAHIVALASFSSLRKLCMGGLTGQEMVCDVPAACRSLPHLTSLTMKPHSSRVPTLGPLPEGHLHELTQLQLLEMDGWFERHGVGAGNLRPWAVIMAIGRLTGLRSLSLCLPGMPPSDSSAWSRLTRLTHVSISSGVNNGCGFLHPALANLRSVRLSGGGPINEGNGDRPSYPALQIPTHLSLLTSLVVASPCDSIPWGRRWPNLQQLEVYNTSHAWFKDLKALAALPALRSLKLKGVLLQRGSPPLPPFPRLRNISCTLHELCDEQAANFFGAVFRAEQLSLGFEDFNVTSKAISSGFGRLQSAQAVEFTSKLAPTFYDIYPRRLEAALQGLAAAPTPVLMRVSIWSCIGVTVHCIRCLRLFPQLEQVVFRDTRVPEELLLAARELEPAVSVQVV